MTDPNVVFVATETTGLQAGYHEVWEVGLIHWTGVIWSERTWLLPVDVGRADPKALDIGGFHARHPQGCQWPTGSPTPVELTTPPTFARQFESLTLGKHLVGAVVSFDEERLRRLLRQHHRAPGWHYHLVDVEALAAGYLASRGNPLAPPPWVSENLSSSVGVDPTAFDRHTALGAARWAKAIYEAVLGPLPDRIELDEGLDPEPVLDAVEVDRPHARQCNKRPHEGGGCSRVSEVRGVHDLLRPHADGCLNHDDDTHDHCLILPGPSENRRAVRRG